MTFDLTRSNKNVAAFVFESDTGIIILPMTRINIRKLKTAKIGDEIIIKIKNMIISGNISILHINWRLEYYGIAMEISERKSS